MNTFWKKSAVLAGVGAALVLLGLLGATVSAQRPQKLAAEPQPADEYLVDAPSPAVLEAVLARHPGCWEVSGTDGTALAATWIPSCPNAVAPELGEQSWFNATVRLPARELGAPPMGQAVAKAQLSRDLALEGAGALLYLPISAETGYYVAGWTTRETHEERDDAGGLDRVTVTRRGIVVGLYGAPPPSVATPSGRVYLSEEFSPRGIRKGHRMSATPPAEAADMED